MEDDRYWLSVDDLVHLTNCSKSTVYSWASKFGWKSNEKRPVRYRTADVMAAIGDRT